MNNFLTAWILIIIGFINNIPPSVQLISLIVGIMFAIVGTVTTIIKLWWAYQDRKRDRQNEHNNKGEYSYFSF